MQSTAYTGNINSARIDVTQQHILGSIPANTSRHDVDVIMAKARDGIRAVENSNGSSTDKAAVRLRGHAHRYEEFSRTTDAKRRIEEFKTAIRNGSVISTAGGSATRREALRRRLDELLAVSACVTALKLGASSAGGSVSSKPQCSDVAAQVKSPRVSAWVASVRQSR
jgi:hypothetical protein